MVSITNNDLISNELIYKLTSNLDSQVYINIFLYMYLYKHMDKILLPTLYVKIPKVILVYYLNKSHNSMLNKSCG